MSKKCLYNYWSQRVAIRLITNKYYNKILIIVNNQIHKIFKK